MCVATVERQKMSWPLLDKYVAKIREELGDDCDNWELVKSKLVELVGDVAQDLSLEALRARYIALGDSRTKLCVRSPIEFPSALTSDESDCEDETFLQIPSHKYFVAEMLSIEDLLGESSDQEVSASINDPYGRTRRERYCVNPETI